MLRLEGVIVVAASWSAMACGGGGAGGGNDAGALGGSPGAGGSAGFAGAFGTGATAGSSGSAGVAGATSECAHHPCLPGPPLSAACDGCVATVCGVDAYCCSAAWDQLCAERAATVCGLGCGGGTGTGGSGGNGLGGGAGACNKSNCSNGCCSSTGQCLIDSNEACGQLGVKCADCTAIGSVCDSGTCAGCKPSCAGKACGDSDGCGGVCDGPCAPGQFCSLEYTNPAYACVPCNEKTCAGCCTASGQCLLGHAGEACGRKGAACQDCGSQACNGSTGQCVPCGSTCGPAQGFQCCQSDGCGKVCPGADCSPSGPEACQITQHGAAKCMGPSPSCHWDCAGCCVNGQCVTGNLPGQCGSMGVSCVDCVGLQTTCDANAKTCVGCVPDCSNAFSCGKGDGCGGKCTGNTGGNCYEQGEICSEQGKCVCGVPGQKLCPGPTQFACIDVTKDEANCGGCGVTCPAGISCKDGVCDCGPSKLFCPSGNKGVAGVCTNLASDPNHCGSCTQQCLGAGCINGVCGPCMAGLTSCGSVCTDASTDPKNCGGCGQACPSGVSCSAGKCQCPASTTHCGGVCTNTQVDPKHCGGCNAACASGSCVNGNCV